ncbi:MAG: nucleotidyltransferase domain-containing protein [Candidatus Bipolaricaulota bacterium]|nr:nucleotidyltransferase domain-containing protein [Candidatus Bipolaricaulota bacterium]
MDNKTIETLDRYKEMLKHLGINPERVIVFGSHAQGRAGEHSDVDVVVISEAFVDMNLRERLEILGIAAARIMEPIQAWGFTAEEFAARREGSFVGDEVKGVGIEI